MFDFVPFTGTGGIMTHLNTEHQFIEQTLSFDFPQATSRTVTASSIGRNQHAWRIRIGSPSDEIAPFSDRIQGKFSRISTYPDIDKPIITPNIIHSVGNHLAQVFIDKVVDLDARCLAFLMILASFVRIIPHGLRFLCIYPQGWRFTEIRRIHLLVDIVKLRSTIRMLSTFLTFAKRLQTLV